MTSDLDAKLAKLGETYKAIERAKEALRKEPSAAAALSLQALQRDARELRSLLPPLKLVVNNV